MYIHTSCMLYIIYKITFLLLFLLCACVCISKDGDDEQQPHNVIITYNVRTHVINTRHTKMRRLVYIIIKL